MGNRRRYTEEFKREAIALGERIGFGVAAKDLGVGEWSLYRRRKESPEAGNKGIRAFPGHGNPRDEETRRMKKRIADPEEENEILKKAAAIFAGRRAR
jgi:transposase